jgi:hypothetical protein
MYQTSKAYRASMKKLVRNKSYLRVNLGVISQEAQKTAYVSDGTFTQYSNLTKPLENAPVTKPYATFEQNYSKVDRSMYFIPRTAQNYYNAGIVSESLMDRYIKISFKTLSLEIKGLTIDFGFSYPVDFTIETNNETVTFTDNDKQNFVTDHAFHGVNYLIFRASKMSGGATRFRIQSILFGIGISLDTDKIMKSSLKSYVSPVAESLPTIDFNLTVANYDGEFDIENKDSAINFMEIGQDVQIYHSYTLDDGELEEFQVASIVLKSWDADDTEANFVMVDKFNYMDNRYYKGVYDPNGMSLYNLAEEVLIDAKVSEYWIDPYLKTVTVYNPIPICTHREALQYIANAGRCVLNQNREGKIIIKSSFIPDVSVFSGNVAEFGNVQAILSDESKREYATFEQNFSKTNRTQYFFPRNANYMNTGYVSESFSDANGKFSMNPVIRFTMEAAFTFYSFLLRFGTAYPEAFTIRTYNNGTLNGTHVITETEQNMIVNLDFINVDSLEIEFTKARPRSRVYLEYVEFGDETNYHIMYHPDLYKTPKGRQLEKVKEVQILRSILTYGKNQIELNNEAVQISQSQNSFMFEFGNAVHGLTCGVYEVESDSSGNSIISSYTAQITERGSYYCVVTFNNPPVIPTSIRLVIYGYEFMVASSIHKFVLNSTGKTEKWTNPLISTNVLANDLGEWMSKYYASDREYELDYRGDPSLDVNDLVFLENKYVDDMQVRIYEHTIDFNGALRGAIKARREVD